jgi:hypothetical protein
MMERTFAEGETMRARTYRTLAVVGLGVATCLLAACRTPTPVPAGAEPGAPVAKTAPAPTPAANPAGQPATAPAAAGAGRIEVAQKSVDLGDVRQGEKVTHTFVLKNVGTDVLHIRRAKGS